jgi:transposase-like protein
MRVEVLGVVERHRRWSRDDKIRIIEETLAPGEVVTEYPTELPVTALQNLCAQIG